MSCCTFSSKTCYEETRIEWELADFFSHAESKSLECLKSNIFSLGRRPWILGFKLGRILDDDDDFYRACWPYIRYIGRGDGVEVDYECGLKKLDGSVEPICSGRHYFNIGTACSMKGFSVYELLEQKHEMTPPDGLTITCALKHGSDLCNQQPALHGTQVMKLIKLDTLSENFKSLFSDKESCDVTLQMKNMEFHAHKIILMARSSVFAAMFRHDTLEKQTNIIKVSDCDPESFGEFLEFLYCGKLEDISFRSAYYLYSTSHKYGIPELKYFCIEYMQHNLEEDTFLDTVELADAYDEKELLDASQKYFNKNIKKVVESSDWESLMEENYRLANRLIKGMASKCKIED